MKVIKSYALLLLSLLLGLNAYCGRQIRMVFLDMDSKDTIRTVEISGGDYVQFAMNHGVHFLNIKRSSKDNLTFSSNGYLAKTLDHDILMLYSGENHCNIYLVPTIASLKIRWDNGLDYDLFDSPKTDTIDFSGLEPLRTWVSDSLHFPDAISQQYHRFCGNDLPTELQLSFSIVDEQYLKLSDIKVKHDHYSGYIEAFAPYLIEEFPTIRIVPTSENNLIGAESARIFIIPTHL